MNTLLNRLGMLGLASVMAMPAYADSCFQAKGELGVDAQEIRQKAADMGWKVGTMALMDAIE